MRAARRLRPRPRSVLETTSSRSSAVAPSHGGKNWVTSERMVAGGERRNEEGIQVVLLRHGQSEWNSAKRFSGWMDIDLTEAGRIEAARAGKLLKLHNFEFDEAHASVLKRAVRTLWTALHSSNHHWIPVKHTWRLNERHYGALTGLSKTEAEQQLGSMMLQKYRRGYDTEPLPMKEDHPYWTGNDRRYRDLGALLPRGESLKQCKARILPYWYETVVPSVRAGRRVLIAAHNNVLRCLCKHLDRIPSDNLRALEIPTGDPIVYTLNRETLEPMGAPDELGFRGKFLDASDLHEESNPMTDLIHVNDVVSLEMLQREARRLGLDLATIKCISEITGQMRITSSSSAAATAASADDYGEEPYLFQPDDPDLISKGRIDKKDDDVDDNDKVVVAAAVVAAAAKDAQQEEEYSSPTDPLTEAIDESFRETRSETIRKIHSSAATTMVTNRGDAGSSTSTRASSQPSPLSSETWGESAEVAAAALNTATENATETEEGGGGSSMSSSTTRKQQLPPLRQPMVGSSMADPMDDWVSDRRTDNDWWKTTGF